MAKPKKRKKTTRPSGPRFLATAVGSFANMIVVAVTGGTLVLAFYAAKRML